MAEAKHAVSLKQFFLWLFSFTFRIRVELLYIIEMSESVKVMVRCRPMNSK